MDDKAQKPKLLRTDHDATGTREREKSTGVERAQDRTDEWRLGRVWPTLRDVPREFRHGKFDSFADLRRQARAAGYKQNVEVYVRDQRPYGLWICADDRIVQFNRHYQPTLERRLGVFSNWTHVSNRNEIVPYAEIVWFYNHTCPPWQHQHWARYIALTESVLYLVPRTPLPALNNYKPENQRILSRLRGLQR